MAEICVALGILALIAAAALPMFTRYRGRTAVNRSIEITKAVLERGVEEARTIGSPIPSNLKATGLTDVAVATSPPETKVVVRIRKRLSPATTPILVTERSLSDTVNVTLAFSQLGTVDIDSQQDLTGVYVEFATKPTGGTSQILAAIPVDVNGELVLHQSQTAAALGIVYNNYSRSLDVSAGGTVVLDRR